GKSTTQSYRTPVYYVDLTLKDGINLQQAIQIAKDIDQQSKASGFNQYALDQTARQGYGNARFEVNSEEGLDLVEEFYTDEFVEAEQVQSESKTKTRSKFQQGDFVQDIQKGLQGSVRAVN
ncbi:MAG: hydrolase or metal-binding protein, partial [Acinetobacter sp.]